MRAADQIVQVQVRSPRRGAGRRLRSALGAARLHPTSLPPSAVLVVRQWTAPEAGLRLSPGWERAARRSLADAARRAHRPHRGRVPTHAEALLFADEAEFVACAALALSYPSRPWWLRTLGSQATVARVLADQPHRVPAVLRLLVEWDRVAPVLAALDSDEARGILAAVAQAFDVAGVLSAAPPEPFPLPGQVESAPAPRAPWADVHPLAAAVEREARPHGVAPATLLGVAGLLAWAPHRLRVPDVAATLAAWVRAAETHAGDVRAEPPSASDPGAAAARVPPPSLAPADRPAPPSPPTAPLPGGRPLPRPVAEAPSALPPSLAGSAPEPSISAPVSEDAPPDPVPWMAGTATRLGGAFFLLPLMRSLALPDAFETDWRLASTTGPWGVLEALVRGLLGDAHGLHAADPLWRALAALDSRPPGAPPRTSVEPTNLVFPPGWRPPAQHAPTPGLAGLPPALAAWTHLALPTVQDRLVDALDLSDPEEITGALLLRDATLHVTPSHVDLVLPLACATLTVRRAGLDADPGWVPAVGRVVQFHYVS